MKGELLGEIRLAKKSSNLEKLEEGGRGGHRSAITQIPLHGTCDPISIAQQRENETHPSAWWPHWWFQLRRAQTQEGFGALVSPSRGGWRGGGSSQCSLCVGLTPIVCRGAGWGPAALPQSAQHPFFVPLSPSFSSFCSFLSHLVLVKLGRGWAGWKCFSIWHHLPLISI